MLVLIMLHLLIDFTFSIFISITIMLINHITFSSILIILHSATICYINYIGENFKRITLVSLNKRLDFRESK